MTTPDAPSLDLSSLRLAVTSLRNAVEVVRSAPFQTAEPAWQDTLVAGVIQHFEFTFELCWKMLKRQLEREMPNPSELDVMNYRDLIRLGHQRGLLRSVHPWFEFRELRNITSHTYARVKATQVAAGAPRLLAEAENLLHLLEARRER